MSDACPAVLALVLALVSKYEGTMSDANNVVVLHAFVGKPHCI